MERMDLKWSVHEIFVNIINIDVHFKDICQAIYTEDVVYKVECMTLCRMARDRCMVILSNSSEMTREKCITAAFDDRYNNNNSEYLPQKLLLDVHRFRENCRLSRSQHNGMGYVLCKFKSQECRYSEWNEWSSCTKDCNDYDNISTRYRTRYILDDSKNGLCIMNELGTLDIELCIDLPYCNNTIATTDYKKQVEIVEPLINYNKKDNNTHEWIINAYKQYPELVEVIKDQIECKILKSVRGSSLQQSTCTCPKNFTPCTFSMAIVNKEWVNTIEEFCRQNPYAYIVFEKISRYIYYCNIGMLILQEADKELECNYNDSNEYICCQPIKEEQFKINSIHFIILGIAAGIIFLIYPLAKITLHELKIWKFKQS